MRTGALRISVAFLALTTGVALAHSGATGIVKQRMDMMVDIADQMKTIGRMLSGQHDFNPPVVVAAAERIAQHGRTFKTMFPKGTTSPPSEARPEIWANWDDFLRHSDEMQTLAIALAVTAKSADDPQSIGAPFSALGMSCKSCHQDFRQKK